MIGQTFGQWGAWSQEAKIEHGMGVAFFYDDPESTPPDKLRSDAGAFVSNDFVTTDPAVHIVDVAGGSYAVATHLGSFDGLPNAWNEFSRSPLPDGYTYRNAPPFEVYVKMSHENGGVDNQTELYMAIQKV